MPTTGTALDEFLPIYAALAVPHQHRRAFTQVEVDGMDVSVVAAMLELRLLDTQDLEAVAADMNRRRVEAARRGEPPPTW